MAAERARYGQGAKRRRRRGLRRWCLPPPQLREPGEALEGMHVLEELPPDVALALWTALRDVMLWSATPAERRAALFSPGADARRPRIEGDRQLPTALVPPLTTLATVVSHPGEAIPEVVSRMCLEVARWGREQNAMGTAVSFAQAAALAWPDAPAPALEVGRLAVEWGRLQRAETWLRRAIGLARRARDWESYGGAYVVLGEIYLRYAVRAGATPGTTRPGTRLEAAARYYEQAARVSRRHRLRLVRAEAMHGMMRVCMETGDLEQAELYARRALRLYRRDHPRRPELESDVARLMMRTGQHERAVPLLQRLLSGPADADRRLECGAMLAHAAAHVGDRPLYERSWSAAWSLLDGREGSPAALVQLGRAAARASDWLRVQQTVRAFSELSSEQRQSPAAAEMEEIAGLARRH